MNEQLLLVKECMKKEQVDTLIVPQTDFHQSEYVGDHFKVREFLTGFSGSNGTALVTETFNGLYTDGRYYLQAEKELKDSGFVLCHEDDPKEEPLFERAVRLTKEGGVIAFDGRLLTMAECEKLKRMAEEKKITLSATKDLAGSVWKDRPALPESEIWLLPEGFCGTPAAAKVASVREKLEQQHADALLVSRLEHVAYLTNLRASDIHDVCVALAYMVITREEALLFTHKKTMTKEAAEYEALMGITVKDYDELETVLTGLGEAQKRVWVDPYLTSVWCEKRLLGAELIKEADPVAMMKAVKDAIEQENIRLAHFKDGLVMTNFSYWIKHTDVENLTEWDVVEKLHELRSKQENFIGDSFDTIAGYAENGAIVHYEPEKETAKPLDRKGVLLVDTGGHYKEGTTDITRTYAMGPVTDQEKKMYTLVLKGHLALERAIFPEGTRGINLDVLARQFLWQEKKDYRHGTGHGVGFVLSVHEGPNSFRQKPTDKDGAGPALVCGMVTTDEPGYYEDGAFGIRIEDELLTVDKGHSFYGRFFGFENLTLCPMDPDMIEPALLTPEEKEQLLVFHDRLCEKLSGHLSGEVSGWLAGIAKRFRDMRG